MHGNEYRLGKRLKELINCLDIDTKTYLFGNSSNRATFIQSTVDTRDYLTHYDRRDSAKIFYNNHLFYSSIVLKAVFAIIIYRDLGIEENVVLNRLKGNYYYANAIEQIKAFIQ